MRPHGHMSNVNINRFEDQKYQMRQHRHNLVRTLTDKNEYLFMLTNINSIIVIILMLIETVNNKQLITENAQNVNEYKPICNGSSE